MTPREIDVRATAFKYHCSRCGNEAWSNDYDRYIARLCRRCDEEATAAALAEWKRRERAIRESHPDCGETGGQGRTADDVRGYAGVALWLFCMALGAVAVFAACVVLFGWGR